MGASDFAHTGASVWGQLHEYAQIRSRGGRARLTISRANLVRLT
jgi:hypothetical protein